MFARTWSEELVAEWLAWRGYAVSIGVPVGTGSRGGRKEADVVGFRFEENKLVIEHWEISSIYRSSGYIVEAIMKKFSEDRVKAIVKYIAKILGLNSEQIPELEYRKYAIIFSSWDSLKRAKESLKDKGITLYSLREFFETYVKPIIDEQVREKKTFPDSHWLLNMLYKLKEEGIMD